MTVKENSGSQGAVENSELRSPSTEKNHPQNGGTWHYFSGRNIKIATGKSSDGYVPPSLSLLMRSLRRFAFPRRLCFPSATPTCLETGSVEASPLPATSSSRTRGSFSNECLLIFFFFMKTSLAQPIKIAQNIPGLGETGQCPAPSGRHPCYPFLAFPLDLVYKSWSG